MRTDTAHEFRRDAAGTLFAAGHAVKPEKTGLGTKIALVSTLFRLVRRYPLPALAVGGVALVIYMSRRHASTSDAWR